VGVGWDADVALGCGIVLGDGLAELQPTTRTTTVSQASDRRNMAIAPIYAEHAEGRVRACSESNTVPSTLGQCW
jgi:hypothetical protein